MNDKNGSEVSVNPYWVLKWLEEKRLNYQFSQEEKRLNDQFSQEEKRLSYQFSREEAENADQIG